MGSKAIQMILLLALTSVAAAQTRSSVLEEMASSGEQIVPPIEPSAAQTSPLASAPPLVPQDWQPPQIELAPIARKALKVSDTWADRAIAPVEGSNGRVIYTFGAGLATLVCAPLKVCTIELQPGEKIVGEPHLGDSVRWKVEPARAGQGADAVELLVLKPIVAGTETTLVIPTDRRIYFIRLQSESTRYVARMAFEYPNEDRATFSAFIAERQASELAIPAPAPALPIDGLWADYRIQIMRGARFAPVAVLDDGHRTYLRLPPSARQGDLPALLVEGDDGQLATVNYRIKGSWWIVDQLIERAELVSGTGWRQKKVLITRQSDRAEQSTRNASAGSRP